MTAIFDGKVVLVTGAAAGIGRASAHAFARAGAKVVVADLDEAGAKETVELIGGDSVARYIRADVSDHNDAQRMVDAALSAFGRLDIAHNNAGIEIDVNPVTAIDPADWDKILNVNLTGVFACMRAQIPAMLEAGGGAIVNTASVLGTVAIANQAAYVASKHGVIGLTKAAALEYSSAGIRINAVCPGAVRTAMVEKLVEDVPGFLQLMVQTHPIGRLGTPDEIADVVTWLSSPAASFITGQAIHADGGYSTQ